jgi:hypothetical protein
MVEGTLKCLSSMNEFGFVAPTIERDDGFESPLLASRVEVRTRDQGAKDSDSRISLWPR